MDLYITTDVPIPLATTVVPNCDPIYYKIKDVVPEVGFSGTLPEMTINSNGGNPILRLEPYEASSYGVFQVTLEACAVVNPEQENCDLDSTLTVFVHDPCLKAVILSGTIQTVMQ